jgi:hypothetical protein
MTKEECLKKMHQIAKEEYMVNGACVPVGSQSLVYAMNDCDISKRKSLKNSEPVYQLSKYKNLSDMLQVVFEECSLQEKILDDLSESKTLGELIATVFYDKKGGIKVIENLFYGITTKPIHIKNTLSELFIFADRQLAELTLDKYKNILKLAEKKHSIPKYSMECIANAISNFLFKCAADARVYCPAGLEFADGRFVYSFIEAECKRIISPVTVYEHCIKVFPSNLKFKAHVIITLKESAEVKPECYGLVLSQSYLNWMKKGYRGQIITIIETVLHLLRERGVVFAIPLPLIEKTHRSSAIELPYLRYILAKDYVSKQDRTFGWYVFETIDIMETWQNRQIKSNIYKAYGDFLDVKLANMQKEDFVLIKSRRPTLQWHEIMRKINAEGVYLQEVMFHKEEEQKSDLNFKMPVWKLWDGTKMSFDDIDVIYADAIRHYVKYLNVDKKRINASTIKIMLEFFMMVNMPKLSALNSNAEMIFYLALEKSIIDERTQRRAITALLQFRSIVNNLKKLDVDLVPKHYRLNCIFTIKNIPRKIVVFDEDEQQSIVGFLQKPPQETDELMSRLELCAVGIQLLSARRIGEVVSDRSGLGMKVGAIGVWGVSSEKQLRFYRSKTPMRESMVLFADMIGQRTDPFSKAMPELLPKLYKEALEITSVYRHLLPDDIKKFLFVVKGKRGMLYSKIRSNLIWDRIKKLFKHLGIDAAKTPHTARHTMATALILAGGTVQDAADALGDEIEAISQSYHEYTSRQDTLKLFADKGRTWMVDGLEDSAELKRLEEDKHRVISSQEMSPNGCKMAGGSCTETVEGRLNCKSFQMLRGAKSCPGCQYLEVSIEDNKAYWVAEFRATHKNMEKTSPGSPAYEYEALHHRIAEKMLQRIEEKEVEAQWEF